jgi:hypothetical protein
MECTCHTEAYDGVLIWKTRDGIPIVEGLRAWDHNLDRVIVKIAGTKADPDDAYHKFWDGWFEPVHADGPYAGKRSSIMDGWRLVVRHPNGELA